MKRDLFIASAFLCVLASCSKNDVDEPKTISSFSLTANIEQPQLDTKADLNASFQTLWASGDVLKVHITNGAGDWSTDQPFTLSSGEGSTSGTFHCGTAYSATDHWDLCAFFPYNYTSSTGADNTGSNVGGDSKMYFNLPESYYEYTSGQSFLPLLANMSGGSTHPASVSLKHVGGAVVVNLTKVPGAAKSLGMTIDGKNITGWMNGVTPTDAGTASGIITSSSGSNSTIWLNFDSSGSVDRSFQFIYPVPTISSTSDITFKMYDKNDLLIWKKTASGQSAIGRAKALVMPNKAVAPIPQNMYLVGYINGADNNIGYAFNNATGSVSGIEITENSYVCLRADDTGDWYMTDAYVGSGNTATVKCQSGEKLLVPAGTYTFSMAYQSDGSIVLSYESE